jgi:NUMOD4 motif
MTKARDELREEWRPVVGYEGSYEVSNFGNVRSLDRMTPGRWSTMKLTPGKVMTIKPDKLGYMRLSLSNDGKNKHHLAHRLAQRHR